MDKGQATKSPESREELSEMNEETIREATADRTTFGFRDVRVDEKARLVRDVFDSVANKYDLMNDLMSFGVHRIWKGALIDWLSPQPGQRLVDVAGGTGDIAERFVRKAEKRGPQPARAAICDINEEMLRAGASRRKRSNQFADAIEIINGDAERLPFNDATFDAYTIAFGIRNVTDMDAALKDARRVLKPGGRFMCLEFSHPTTEGLQWLYDRYSFNAIPRMGQAVAGDGDSYKYLVESIRRFPAQRAFVRRIEAAGFARVQYRNLSGGVAAIHAGWRI